MNAMRAVLAAAVLAMLAGCPQETAPMAPAPTATADAPAADGPIPTESNFIHGSAYYLERIKIPPGADFTVQLIDNQLADTLVP
jgi:putative lipoprotein